MFFKRTCLSALFLQACFVAPALAEYADSRQSPLSRHVGWGSDTASSASARQLVERLTSAAKNDRERAWLIYRWITGNFIHDAQAAVKIGNPARHSIDDLIRHRRGSCEVFAHVTNTLLTLAGLKSKVVVGHANTGQQSASAKGSANHVWNMVWIEGQWRLMDTTWGSGFVDESGFTRQQSDLFFLMPDAQADLLYRERTDKGGSSRGGGADPRPFRNVPPDAAYASFVGFDTKKVVEVAGNGRRVVETFDLANGSFAVLDAPTSYALNSGDQRFVLRSDQFEKLAVVQGRNWTHFQRAGGRFVLDLKALRGELIVMGKRPGQAEYEALLGYYVR